MLHRVNATKRIKMDNEIKNNANEGAAADSREAPPHARERAQFRSLLLSNPNYFGNLTDSQFDAVLKIQANTFYENICSVGFQPQFDRLEAVVHVKQPTGYGGDICSQGTPEYVRFFMSTDSGASWDDLGLTSSRRMISPKARSAVSSLSTRLP
jgi:hypothetical protein